MKIPLSFFAVIATTLFSCSVQKPKGDPLKNVLASQNPKIKRVMDSVAQYELQIRYTQIDRKKDSVIFRDYDFQVDADAYFYPASTVKFPVAVLTLEKLNRTDALDLDTRFYVEGDSVETTFAKAVSEIFAVSDNDANNRLVEFLGQDAINSGMEEEGIRPVRISHRLGQHSDALTTKPLIIYQNDSTTTILDGTFNTAPEPLKLKEIKKGSGFYEEDSLISEPFDFSLKNYYPVQAQHGLLKRVIFPENFSPEERFDLSAGQREFLLTAMHTVPRKVGYDSEEYYDGYCKFFMFGDTKENIPSNIKIYNKVGFAYGTLTDCAYITDTQNNVEFMLTATILVNKNGIFNDDTYEYDEVGIPFLAELGRQLYDYEMKRKK
ncbi:MAG TPA: serine hydrolase [Pricia sp.]|nr:serine hydrolase [Pricia sp.]